MKELCIHVLFVMVKVLRVPASNPLVWQLCLTGEMNKSNQNSQKSLSLILLLLKHAWIRLCL